MGKQENPQQLALEINWRGNAEPDVDKRPEGSEEKELPDWLPPESSRDLPIQETSSPEIKIEKYTFPFGTQIYWDTGSCGPKGRLNIKTIAIKVKEINKRNKSLGVYRVIGHDSAFSYYDKGGNRRYQQLPVGSRFVAKNI